MAIKKYNEEDIRAIAEAIRLNPNFTDTYTVTEMPQAIEDAANNYNEIFTGLITDKESITSFVFPKNVLNTGSILGGCKNLTQVILPNTITHIDDRAFQNCYKLKFDTLPDSITYIGKNANIQFNNDICEKLPEELICIGEKAFGGFTIFTNTTLPSKLEIIKDVGLCQNTLYLTELPKSIKYLGDHALGRCTFKSNTLTFKGMPDYIDSYCFFQSNGLTTINVPWSEGEVANAPWGTYDVTINYNYKDVE